MIVGKPELIVSMATYPPRLGGIVQSLKPLLRQSVPPDRIIVNLANDNFGGSPAPEALPEELIELAQEGLIEIAWRATNLGPHNKYLWTMLDNPDAIVITVDDDLVFDTGMVGRLLDQHYHFPGSVIADRTHRIYRQGDVLAPYASWEMEQKFSKDRQRKDLFATGGAGALYPPHVLDDTAFEVELIQQYSPLADDVWLFVAERRAGVSIVCTGKPHLIYLPGSQEVGLYKDNLEGNRNDVYLQHLFDIYPQVLDELLADCKELPQSDELKERSWHLYDLVPKRLRRLIPKGARKAGLRLLGES